MIHSEPDRAVDLAAEVEAAIQRDDNDLGGLLAAIEEADRRSLAALDALPEPDLAALLAVEPDWAALTQSDRMADAGPHKARIKPRIIPPGGSNADDSA